MKFKDRWILMAFLALAIFTLVATQMRGKILTDKFFTVFDLLETIIDHGRSDEKSRNFIEVNEKDLAKFKEAGKGLD